MKATRCRLHAEGKVDGLESNVVKQGQYTKVELGHLGVTLVCSNVVHSFRILPPTVPSFHIVLYGFSMLHSMVGICWNCPKGSRKELGPAGLDGREKWKANRSQSTWVARRRSESMQTCSVWLGTTNMPRCYLTVGKEKEVWRMIAVCSSTIRPKCSCRWLTLMQP